MHGRARQRGIVQMQGVGAAMRKQHDIAGLQGQLGLAGDRQAGLAVQDQMIGRDAGAGGVLLQYKRRAEVAAHVEGGAHRVQGKQAAETIHGEVLRRTSKF